MQMDGRTQDYAFPNDVTEWTDEDGDGFGDNSDDCLGVVLQLNPPKTNKAALIAMEMVGQMSETMFVNDPQMD